MNLQLFYQKIEFFCNFRVVKSSKDMLKTVGVFPSSRTEKKFCVTAAPPAHCAEKSYDSLKLSYQLTFISTANPSNESL